MQVYSATIITLKHNQAERTLQNKSFGLIVLHTTIRASSEVSPREQRPIDAYKNKKGCITRIKSFNTAFFYLYTILLTLRSRIVNFQSICFTKSLFYFSYDTHLSL